MSNTTNNTMQTSLKNKLNQISEFLSLQATDLTNNILAPNSNTILTIEDTVKQFSILAKEVTLIAIQANANRIDDTDKSSYDEINEFAKELGNAQFDLIEIRKLYKQMNDTADEIKDKGFNFADQLITLEARLRTIKAALNVLKVFENNPLAVALFANLQKTNS